MMTAPGECSASFFVTSVTTAAFFANRSMRLMPGPLGKPAVMIARCEPAVSR